MENNLEEQIDKAESFLIAGNYEEAIERSFKIVEFCLQYIFKKLFTELSIDRQIKILEQIKNEFSGKSFNQLMIGEKLRIFDDHKLLSDHANLSKDINPSQILKINNIRVDSAHQKRKITKGDAFYAFGSILSFLEKLNPVLPISTVNSGKASEKIPPNSDLFEGFVLENLPSREYSEFIGREDKIEEIQKMLLHEKVHVLSIDGIGGVGKSALALEITHKLKEEKIFDAIIWVSAKRDKLTFSGIVDIENTFDNLEDLFNEILKVFKEDDFLKHGSIETKEKMVLELLKNNHCLIVVDNLETINDAKLKNFLIDIDFPSESKVLITSRKRLGQVEYVIYLDKFTLKETRDFVESQLESRSFSGTCTENLLTDIYSKTGGVPLDIKVIVPWIVEGKIHDKFIVDIDKETDILKFCFEKVFNEFLSDQSRKLFCVLSQAPSEISETALRFVSELQDEEFNESLSSLINYSLIYKKYKDSEAEESFGMLPLTQEFGKMMSGTKFVGLKEKINKSYLRFIELSQSEEHSAKKAIAINKAEEAGRLFSKGELDAAEKLFKEAINYDKDCDYALYLFSIYSKERQDYGRAASLIEKALSKNKINPYYWSEYASILESSGDYKQAEKVLVESLSLTESNKTLVQKLCLIKTKLQKNNDVIDLVKSSIDEKDIDNKSRFINTLLTTSLLEAYWRLSSTSYKTCNFDKSRDLLLEGIEYLQFLIEEKLIYPNKSNLLWEEKKIYNRLGDIAKQSEDYDNARNFYERSLYKIANFQDRKNHNSLIKRKLSSLPKGNEANKKINRTENKSVQN